MFRLLLTCLTFVCLPVYLTIELIAKNDFIFYDSNGWNSLHLAVRAGLPKLVEQLIQTDRRCVNIVTRDRQAPLHIAVAR